MRFDIIFFSSLLLFTVSRDRKRKDGETYQSVLAAIVERVLEESGIRGVVINNRILNVFHKKINDLERKFKKEVKRGGKCVEALKNKWRAGKNYEIKIYYDEVDVLVLKEQNCKLQGEKRKLEESLVEEEAKRLRVEEKLSNAVNKAQKNANYYKKEFKRVVRKLTKKNRKEIGRASGRERV